MKKPKWLYWEFYDKALGKAASPVINGYEKIVKKISKKYNFEDRWFTARWSSFIFIVILTVITTLLGVLLFRIKEK